MTFESEPNALTPAERKLNPILKLVLELQHEFGMAVLLITHDLGVVANVAEEIVVMYRGEVVESGTLEDIFRRPEHP